MRALLMILMTLAVDMVLVRMVRGMILLALLLLVLADRRLKHAQHQVLVRRHDPRELPALPE